MASSKSGVTAQILPLPKGGGSIQGLGETFQPDLRTGTGNLSLPLRTPPGREDMQPELALNYSTGTGNGAFGMGWRLSIPSVRRKLSKGIPCYRDRVDGQGNPVWHEDEDIFILSESDDLVHVGGDRYRPRVEGTFFRTRKTRADDGQACWMVEARSGLRSFFGTSANSRIFSTEGGKTRILSWLLQETRDPHGNRVVYSYARDDGADLLADLSRYPQERHHDYNQVYLSSIAYTNYVESALGAERFLWRIDFDYGEFDAAGKRVGSWEARPDPFSTFRCGFELRTVRRCRRILIKRRLPGAAEQYEIIRSYKLTYRQADYSGHSLLTEFTHTGHAGNERESFPPIALDYTPFDPTQRRYETFTAACDYLPEKSLADPNYELVDLDGYGLPGVIHTTTTGYRYWRNLGDMRLAAPRPLTEIPAGVTLADTGVQFADMEGNGSADLLVTTGSQRGYYVNDFAGEWDQFRPMRQTPSVDLEDPHVRLVDLDGDGVVDVLSTQAHHFLYIRNVRRGGRLHFDDPLAVARQHDRAVFPDVYFDVPDRRVRLADMTGDGMQDVVLLQGRRISYWPNLGHGRFGRRITMSCSPDLPHRYAPERLFLSDCDGDGAADLVYVDFGSVHIWINRGGNGWSSEIVVEGTPAVADVDSVRVADMRGSGTAGILWSYDYSRQQACNFKYLDFTGGVQPLLLSSIDNNTGARTQIEYRPSTGYWAADARAGKHWKTHLPIPVQLVARVSVRDEFSANELVTEYDYHHGYWDGVEREFRGFGRVDQRDITTLSTSGQQNERSHPVETRTWFHPGDVTEAYGQPGEVDFSDEFWPGDRALLSRPEAQATLLQNLQSQALRLALRALQGKVLRTEMYALDGSVREERPYTVTEHLHGVTPLPVGVLLPPNPPAWQQAVFLPHVLAQRVTQWERGEDPLSQFTFMDEYDAYGQPRKQVRIACPRGWRGIADTSTESFLATCSWTTYAQRDDLQSYIVDRVASTTSYTIDNNGSRPVLDLKNTAGNDTSLRIIGQTVSYYDGVAFVGKPFGDPGAFGAVTRSETLILTPDIVHDAYRSGQTPVAPPEIPPYLQPGVAPVWTIDYPQAYRSSLNALAGYTFYPGAAGDEHKRGYFTSTGYEYDFHTAVGYGVLKNTRNSLGHETRLDYDIYQLMITKVIESAVLISEASYDYRAFQPERVTGPNGNRTLYAYTPLGLLKSVADTGRAGENVGDAANHPGVRFNHDLNAYVTAHQPLSVRTRQRLHHFHDTHIPQPERDTEMEMVEYTDGFGRLLQARTRTSAVGFGVPPFDDAGLPANQSAANQDAVAQASCPGGQDRVLVSGWQTYDDKGRVFERYEPFFACGWTYQLPGAAQCGQKTTLFYDPRGEVVRTMNPDGSEQRIVFGVPGTLTVPDLTTPDTFEPTPWESYTYDELDNAGRTHPALAARYQHHANTAMSTTVDALGRVVSIVRRNRNPLPTGGWSAVEEHTVTFTHDTQGNRVKVVDALGRLAVQYVYDLTPGSVDPEEADEGARLLRIEQLDGGVRRFVRDALGNEIESRDARGALLLHVHDDQGRRTHGWARDQSGEPLTLRERLIYGDAAGSGLTPGLAQGANLYGRLYRHYDEAGLVTVSRYDAHGNATEEYRQVIADAPILAVLNSPPPNWEIVPYRVNWQPPPGVALDAYAATILEQTVHSVSATFDALRRLRELRYPQDVGGHRQKLQLDYSPSGEMTRVALNGTVIVDRIAYNARGQRMLITYGNGLMTRYAYDTQSARLVRMRTERYAEPAPMTFHPIGAPLQDFAYTHDLASNILAIEDRVPGSGFAGSAFGPDRLQRQFSYDSLYRLRSATGRKCKTARADPPWADAPSCHAASATRGYTERYTYDHADNLTGLVHAAGASSYTRVYTLAPDSNRLKSLNIGAASYRYEYDANGNLTREATARYFEWDSQDRLRVFRHQVTGQPPTEYALYLHDTDGTLVKKVLRRHDGSVESATTIDSVFEHRRRTSTAGQKEESVLHVLDGKRRIATVRAEEALHLSDTSPAVQYHLGDHLESSQLVVDDTGGWINREEYTPFGDTSFGGFAQKRYRLTGKARAPESSLYDYGARHYAPWLARWLSCDPLSFESDGEGVRVPPLNPYTYVENRPMVAIDPNGRVVWFIVIAAVAITGLTSVSAANAPMSKKTRLYSRVSHAEHSANVALFVITSGAGMKMSQVVLQSTGRRVLAASVGGINAGAVHGVSSVAVHDVFQGKTSSLETYVTAGAYGAGGGLVFGVAGGTASRVGQYLRWGRPNSLVINALKKGDLPIKRVAMSQLKGTLKQMGEITMATDREVLLYTVGRQQLLKLGGPGSVNPPLQATGIVAHTHPPGFTGVIMVKTAGRLRPGFSQADKEAIRHFVNQHGGSGTHIIVVPNEINPGNNAALTIPPIVVK